VVTDGAKPAALSVPLVALTNVGHGQEQGDALAYASDGYPYHTSILFLKLGALCLARECFSLCAVFFRAAARRVTGAWFGTIQHADLRRRCADTTQGGMPMTEIASLLQYARHTGYTALANHQVTA
jgi:hypothetical protein